MGSVRLLWHMLKVRYPIRDQWTVVLVGQMSGLRTGMPWVTFRTVDQALSWCVAHNSQARSDGCHYVPERIRR